jgi:hypothetical protein
MSLDNYRQQKLQVRGVRPGDSVDDRLNAIVDAEISREHFHSDIIEGRLGRGLGGFSISEAFDTSAIFESLTGRLQEGEAAYLIAEDHPEQSEFSVFHHISEPSDLDDALAPYIGGHGNVHLVALPVGEVALRWRYADMNPIQT